jgi:hypothetical protein
MVYRRRRHRNVLGAAHRQPAMEHRRGKIGCWAARLWSGTEQRLTHDLVEIWRDEEERRDPPS